MKGASAKILEVNNAKAFCEWMVPKMVENLPTTADHSLGKDIQLVDHEYLHRQKFYLPNFNTITISLHALNILKANAEAKARDAADA